jgi:DNA-binding winged helix-turn-helix (wHTH) protein/Tfp pilus assembly protein PilF/TolB-like protein
LLASSPKELVRTPVEASPIVYRFGDFRLDEVNRLLTRDGEEIALPARSFDSLLMLVRRHGQLVTKAEMMDAVWAKSFVEESNLTVAISTLRRALNEDPNDRKFIQTVSGRGYRFIGQVVVEEPGVEAPAVEAVAAASEASVAPGAAVEVPNAAIYGVRRGIWLAVAAVLVVGLVGGWIWWRAMRPAVRLHSIAILPMTGKSVDDYVLLGLTDTLISRVEGTVEVRPMSSVLKYSAAPADPATVGREQNADGVVTSTVSQDASGTSLNIKLVRAADAKTLWSDSFSDAGRNMARLQIAAGNALDAELVKVADHAAAPKTPAKAAVNDQAYQLYLRGRYCWNRRTEEGLRQSIDYFRQSIAADPNYALAYAGLADSYALLASFSVESGRAAIPDARAAALSAIQLDPTLAEPHASLGMIYFFTDWNGPAAEGEFERAIALNPNYATAHHWYALDLAAMGRFPQALYEIRRAQALDPLSLIIDTNVGWIEYLSHDYDAALADYKKVLELDPSFVRALTRRGIVEIRKGDAGAAVVDLTSAARLSGDPYILGLLGQAQAASGATAAAEKTRTQLEEMAKTKYVPPFALALVELGLGHKAEAIQQLGQAVVDRSTSMVYAKIDPSLDEIRGDAEFQKVIVGMRF